MLLGPCSVYTVFALFSVLMLGRGWLMWTGRGILSSWLFNSSMMDVCPLGVLTCDTKIFILHAHSHVSIHMTTPDFPVFSLPFFFFRFYLFIFREQGREGERKGEKHQCVVASCAPPTGDLGCNPGMCPTGNQTGDPLVPRPALNPLSHTSRGCLQSSNLCPLITRPFAIVYESVYILTSGVFSVH